MKRRKKSQQPGSAPAARASAKGPRPDRGDCSPVANDEALAAALAPAAWRPTILAAGLIVFAALAAFCNSFAGRFVYDDQKSIEENLTIRQLWPIWSMRSPPCDGETVGGRPLLNLSLAINYALGGLHVWGYHALNLLIHIGAALLLFGILRRTFLMSALRDRFGQAATALSLASALIWTVHPLQTESVTYIVQRAESLAGFFYLLTLYCVIRGAGEEGASPLSLWERVRVRVSEIRCQEPSLRVPDTFWYAAAVLACLLGTACKEILVTAPLLVLLYDRTFLAGSFETALRRRWGLYLGLSATWILLAYLVLSTGLIARQAELGAPDPLSYARSQPAVILYYLRLAVWPNPLCMSYEWPVANTLDEILPAAVVIAALLAITLWGLGRRKPLSLLGAWFFLILAPTSSILPLNQLAHEHRMYLPLAAVVVLLVAGGYQVWRALVPRAAASSHRAAIAGWLPPLGLLAAVLFTLGYLTVTRNSYYWSLLTMWQDVVAKRPNNYAAHNNLGVALMEIGENDEAIKQYHRALRLRPNYAEANNSPATAITGSAKSEKMVELAIRHYREAVRLKPDYIDAHNNLGNALVAIGKSDEAIEHFQKALRLWPDDVPAHNDLAAALANVGRTDEAITHYREALRLNADYVSAHINLAATLADLGRTDEAIGHYRAALRLKPDDADAHYNLANVLADLGGTDEAIQHYQEALRLKPDDAVAHSNLGATLAGIGRVGEAIEHYRAALRLQPDSAVVQNNLAAALAAAGRTGEAIERYEQLLRQNPNHATALSRLAWLLATRENARGSDPDRTIQLAERARDLGGSADPKCLDTLAAVYAAAGRFDDAIVTAQRAARLAESAGQEPLAQAIQGRLELYRDGRPYREVPRSPAQSKP